MFNFAVFIKRGDICLTGTTSVIMFFIYGLVVFMEPLFKQLKGQSAIVRGMTYGLLIFAIEFFSGTGLKAVNACPWDYSSAVYNINGLVKPYGDSLSIIKYAVSSQFMGDFSIAFYYIS